MKQTLNGMAAVKELEMAPARVTTGACVEGIDLSDGVSEEMFAQLHALLLEHPMQAGLRRILVTLPNPNPLVPTGTHRYPPRAIGTHRDPF